MVDGDEAQRLKDALAENAEMKAQMRTLLAKMAQMEEDFSIRVNRINELHVKEMETLTSNHMDLNEHLRSERDELSDEVDRLTERVEELTDRLEGVSETAAYVTNMASTLEDIKEANESELEAYKRKATREKFDMTTQLRDSQTREESLNRRLQDHSEELVRVKVLKRKGAHSLLNKPTFAPHPHILTQKRARTTPSLSLTLTLSLSLSHKKIKSQSKSLKPFRSSSRTSSPKTQTCGTASPSRANASFPSRPSWKTAAAAGTTTTA
ncbi:hypothetical protein DFJ73DRAFT_833672 [Zopfochytrium polystomum]|nr:hypothetical protein DFJ73DRAFT_833672 [Zopfochytrium polystomum]